jgi:ABC-type transport system involved in multi-copper enzyme maturation permease subunit
MRVTIAGLAKAFTSPNPVTVKELRARMRGARAFVFVTLFLLVMACFVSLLYSSLRQSMQLPGAGGLETYLVGKVVFGTVVAVQLSAIGLLAPALSAGSIASERQRQTWDLLRTTLLPAGSIVHGKLAASLVYMLLLVLTGLPVVSVAFLLGGVTLQEVFVAVALLVVTALSASALGVFFSSIFRSTLAATVVSYIAVMLAAGGLPMVLGMVTSLVPGFFFGAGYAATAQPTPAQMSVLFYALGFLVCTNPFLSAILTEVLLLEGYTSLVFQVNLGAGFTPWIVPPWLVTVVIHLFTGLLLIRLSIRSVRRRR